MASTTQDSVSIVALRGLTRSAPPAAPARATAKKGAMRAPRRSAKPTDIGAALAASLGNQDLVLVHEEHFTRAPSPAKSTRMRSPRASAALVPEAERPGVTLDVQLADGESAVVLLEEDGVFSWHILGEDVTPPEVHRSVMRQRALKVRPGAKTTARLRTKRFAVNLTLPHVPPKPATSAARARGPVRARGLLSSIGDSIVGKVVARVFRFAAGKVVGAVVDHMERDIQPGMILMSDVDCTKWRLMERAEQLELPTDRPARVMLWVHGTFSSTMGSFGGLSQTPHGKAFLKAMLAKYDAVIGFDHQTLSLTPMQNASALLARLEAQSWAKPPVFDVVSYSRGGEVFRSLVEYALPASGFQCTVDRAVFVACTNNGTELARRKNWDRLIDHYTNLAAGACALVGTLTANSVGTRILGEAIKGLGAFVKALAMAALDDGGVPGVEAMDPSGSFVRELNDTQTGQPTPDTSYYCVITSNFDPDTAIRNGSASEVPAGFWMKVADKPVDELMDKPNDLVVDVPSMSSIDAGAGTFVKKQYDFGTNGSVYHTVYFLQEQTTAELSDWLQLGAPAPARALRATRKRARKARA